MVFCNPMGPRTDDLALGSMLDLLMRGWVERPSIRREDCAQPVRWCRTETSIIYKQTGNPRAEQILLSHTKIKSTVRYLGVDVDDALALAEARRCSEADELLDLSVEELAPVSRSTRPAVPLRAIRA